VTETVRGSLSRRSGGGTRAGGPSGEGLRTRAVGVFQGCGAKTLPLTLSRCGGSRSPSGNGNRVTRSEGATTVGYTYDAENRLVEVSKPLADDTTFVYDADGARIKRAQGDTATYFIGSVEIETDEGDVVETHSIYSVGGGVTAVRIVTSPGDDGEVTFTFGDHLGSSATIWQAGDVGDTDPGTRSAQYYYPYGEPRNAYNPALPTDHTFTGQITDGLLDDGGTGLMYYNARYYDPQVGRFAAADTIVPNPANPQDFNRYAYVGNNPVNATDPSGNWPWDGCLFGTREDGSCWGAGVGRTIVGVFDVTDGCVGHKNPDGSCAGADDIRGAWNWVWEHREAFGLAIFVALSCAASGGNPAVCSAVTLLAFNGGVEAIDGGDPLSWKVLVLTGLEIGGGWVIGKVLSKVGRVFRGSRVASAADDVVPPGPYERPAGATTSAQRASVQGKPCVVCGDTAATQVADHIEPLVKQWYSKGGIDTAAMRALDAVQPMCPTCSASQGGGLSWYSRNQKEIWGF